MPDDNTPLPSALAAALSDRYRLSRTLGTGGMATVYLAHDIKHERDVAIKVLHPDLGAALGSDRFLTEIRTTARLQHPHILPLLDSGAADGMLYYVMPAVSGETLRARLERETQLPIPDAVRIASEVAGALDYAHRQGVVHRDIKPENILLHDGGALVADFGIALAVQQAGGSRMTQTGLSLGTPQYMSPEQAMGERVIDGRADIYALGAVTYEMLTGDAPFTGSTVQAIVAKVLSSEPERPTVLRRTIPFHIEGAVLTALAKLPADRFATAAEFATALSDDRADRGPSRGMNMHNGSPARRSLVYAGAAALLAIGAAVGWATRAARNAETGPREYDVGLPDSASMSQGAYTGVTIAPAGTFVVYRTEHANVSELWYRSLFDATVHRIDGTSGADYPSVSPDGRRVAFLRSANGKSTLETVSVDGGTPTVLAAISNGVEVLWMPDGRILLIEGDGTYVRLFDANGGATAPARIPSCILPSPLPGGTSMLCGGLANGGVQIWLGDSAKSRPLRSASPDSAPVNGSHFRVIDGEYVTWVTTSGDLLAAKLDVTRARVGRPVRVVSALAVHEFSGAATYGISATGTLVYGQGANRAVGNLVRVAPGHVDTLPVGRAAFINFNISPDGRRLASTVKTDDGLELRVYDLSSGRHVTWVRGANLAGPVWNATSDRIAFSNADSLFIGSPDLAGRPEFLVKLPGDFSAFSWTSRGRIVGSCWTASAAVSIDVTRRPVTIDTVLTGVFFPRASPDGRWLSYANLTDTEIWIEPWPRDGRRFQVAAGTVDESYWPSMSELAIANYDPAGTHVDKIALNLASSSPVGARHRWLDLPDFRDTPGQSFALTPDNRIVYLRGSPPQPARYLRVEPGFVARMKRAVEEANR